MQRGSDELSDLEFVVAFCGCSPSERPKSITDDRTRNSRICDCITRPQIVSKPAKPPPPCVPSKKQNKRVRLPLSHLRNLRYRLKPIVNRLGGTTRLLELYRLVVVACVFEKVRENVWRPMSFSIPKPSSASDSFTNPIIRPVPGSNTGTTRPSLKPTRGVYSNIREMLGLIRTLAPKPNDPPCLSCLN